MRVHHLLLAGATLVASGACVDGVDDTGSDQQAEELLSDQVWEWHQGWNPVDLGTATNRTCYLQGIAGDFDSDQEMVEVYIAGGRWYLGGTSHRSGVYAAARCVNKPSTAEVSWTQGSARKALESAATHSCFLERIKGHFEGAGEEVSVRVDNGTWYLDGKSNQQGVGASARCVPRPAGPEYTVNADGTVTMKPTATHVCTLNRLTGEFESQYEWVLIYPSQPGGGGNYVIEAEKSLQSHAVLASSYCFSRQPVLQQLSP